MAKQVRKPTTTQSRGRRKKQLKSLLQRPSGEASLIKIRMYQDILGDCFLLSFPGKDGAIYVLIDCGILQGMPRATERMQDIAKDIAHETKSHLDLLVITHEHWDHLSGFEEARGV